MITKDDLKRVLNSDKIKKIDNALKACTNAETDWAKNYWFNVWKKLCIKFGRMDLYRKDLH